MPDISFSEESRSLTRSMLVMGKVSRTCVTFVLVRSLSYTPHGSYWGKYFIHLY